MSEPFFRVTTPPDKFGGGTVCHAVVSSAPWERQIVKIGDLNVFGRKSWSKFDPVWANEVIYYDTRGKTLKDFMRRIVVHHTNNDKTVLENEEKQKGRGYAALGYHFFIAKDGKIYEGRPLEVMGSHAGSGKTPGPTNDPDWGSIGIVLQGDYHHDDDWISSSTATDTQLARLKALVKALAKMYDIKTLIMHREVTGRKGDSTVCPGDHLVPKITALRTELQMSAN